MLMILGGVVLASVMWLIMLYNQTVSWTHAASNMRESIMKIQSESSELKGKVFALFDPERVSQFAAAEGMVADRNQEYAPIIKEWAVASHF